MSDMNPLINPELELQFPRDLYAQLEAQATAVGIGVDSIIIRYCTEGSSRANRKVHEKKTKIEVPLYISIE
jgi:hypothetical protein